MTETKDEVASERDALRVEVARLREVLASTGRPAGASAAQHRFMVTEAERQDLIANGVTSVAGVLLTRDQVRARLEDDQRGLELGDGPVDEGLAKLAEGARGDRSDGVYGVDYVYPSVAPGKIDPDVAGLPGINGPAADVKG